MKLWTTLALMLGSTLSFAGDRITNGGGAWTCRAQETAPATQAMLVDFYEAREQHGWTLRSEPSAATPVELADKMMSRLEVEFPNYAPLWRSQLAEVKSVMKVVDAELTPVADSLYDITPRTSTCNGKWFYTQFALFTIEGQLLIDQALWNSPLLTVQDKAGLLWHETIYRWMRQAHQDQNSRRARRITGLVFSDLSGEKKRALLAEILGGSNPVQQDWMCRIQNGVSRKFFASYGASEIEASSDTLMQCQQAGYKYHCSESEIQCAVIDRDQIGWFCKSRNVYSGDVFVGRGRNLLEAEFRSQSACQLQLKGNDSNACDDAPVCAETH